MEHIIFFIISALGFRFIADRGESVTHFCIFYPLAGYKLWWFVSVSRRRCHGWMVVFLCGVLHEYWMWGQEVRRRSPVVGISLLLSKITKRAIMFNVPVLIVLNSTFAFTINALRRDLRIIPGMFWSIKYRLKFQIPIHVRN